MDFKDAIKLLSERVAKLKDNLQTEESVKNALIMPFIQTLGYDVFNPFEVFPEFTCDIGTKKGEKIDYAIMKDGNPIMLIECKHWSQELTLYDNQLLRYFHVSTAKFGILTNGIVYKFYTDLEHENKMDERPFLEINMLDIRENQIEELKKFHKSYFDVDSIVNAASELKYMKGLKDIIVSEIENPSEQLVRLFTKQVYEGMVTSKVLEQFIDLTKRSFKQVINDMITDRFKTAISKQKQEVEESEKNEENMDPVTPLIVTTEEEKEAFYIAKAILRKVVDADRIFERDTQSYYNILLDDNNRKPICRLYLNTSKKYIGTFDENKKETKHPIESIDDIYKYENEIYSIVKKYEES
ncbi:MAG: type I restriction endonuclease [Petrimonas sp.]|nr:type I restriction endonuclease [Petrimonas sp.]